jgi:hypothetical protein
MPRLQCGAAAASPDGRGDGEEPAAVRVEQLLQRPPLREEQGAGDEPLDLGIHPSAWWESAIELWDSVIGWWDSAIES